MSLGEIDHFATMVMGCESLTSGSTLTSDGKYTYAVLRLYSHAGNEGFLDTVKVAAGKIKEFFLELCSMIKNFLTGGRVRYEQESKRWQELDKQWDKLEDDKAKARAKRHDMLKESMMHALTVAQGKMELVKDSDDFTTFAEYLDLSMNKFKYFSSATLVDEIISHIESCDPEDFNGHEVKWIKDRLEDFNTALYTLTNASSDRVKRIKVGNGETDLERERDRQLKAGARLLKIYSEVYAGISTAFANFLKKDQSEMEKTIN